MLEMRTRDNENQLQNIGPAILDGMYAEPGHIIVTTGRNGQPKQTIKYIEETVAGEGANGVVYKAKCCETGGIVAIKKSKHKDVKNEELKILHMSDHPNIVALKHCFCTTADKEEHYLHLVLEYVPETVGDIMEQYKSKNRRMPLIYVELYIYQICRSLAYIHNSLRICHRDIHPANLLVDLKTHQLKLCDFGNAKVPVKGEKNLCTGFYLAPEDAYKDFKAPRLPTAIDRKCPTAMDMWATGCLLAELLLGERLDWKEIRVDLLGEIKKLRDCKARNYTEPKVLQTKPDPGNKRGNCKPSNETEFKFRLMKSQPQNKPLVSKENRVDVLGEIKKVFRKCSPAEAVELVFQKRLSAEAVDLLSKLLEYSPERRCTALDACMHPFFDGLRDPNTRLPEGQPLPPLFNLTDKELDGIPLVTKERLIPEHARKHNFPMAPHTSLKDNGRDV